MKLLCQKSHSRGELRFAQLLLAAGLRGCCARPVRLFAHMCACFVQKTAPASSARVQNEARTVSRSLSRCGLASRAVDPPSLRVLFSACRFSSE